jgi:hypothetical protein
LTRKKLNDKVSSTLKVEGEFSREFLEETKKVWQPMSLTPLSLEDAREIAENMLALVLFLNEIRDGKEE